MSRPAVSVTRLAQRVIRNPSVQNTNYSGVSSLISRQILTSRISAGANTRYTSMVTGSKDFASFMSTSSALQKGLSPETADPQPKEAESNDTASSSSKVEISIERFHELSDSYLNALVDQLEGVQEGREDVDVEYSSGVLNLTFPPNGQYVLNKQPPNKQIWLSSPITGPKRFDFVMMSEGQDAKEGTGAGDWVYMRDGSALSDILLKEVGVDMRQFWAPNGEVPE